MSTANPTPAKPQRVLACVLCQSRKVKCDRKFPCQNCVRAGVQCVQAALAPRQRRNRIPQQKLLERLHHYEDLLRQNKIDFEPWNTPPAAEVSPNANGRGDDSPDDSHAGGRVVEPDGASKEKMAVKSEVAYRTESLLNAMNQRPGGPHSGDYNYNADDGSGSSQDAVREDEFNNLWEQIETNHHLLFASPDPNVDVSSLHPDQVHIFRLWQIYLDKVNPLFKVTHTPTLQARIIDAAGDLSSIPPSLEALMFSIYCLSIQSLDEEDCRTLFKSQKKNLLGNFYSGCKQALLKCGFLRSRDRDCLTALYLYLISVIPDTDAPSLCSTLGVAMRIAQRMGIHNDFANDKCTVFEAEMRRRLWWSLVMFDLRISEQSGHKDVMLAPTWNCRTPLNVNDSDLRPEMKVRPGVHTQPTEALFVVVRSEICNSIRFNSSFLDFTYPMLKSMTKDVQHGSLSEGDELLPLEKTIEDKYLKPCDLENPVHFATVWTARGQLAKYRLIEYYSRTLKSSAQQTDAQHDVAFFNALRMLECDTKLLGSPLTKCYIWWLVQMQFPFPAYLHIAQYLKRQPVGTHAEKGWGALSDNFDVRFVNTGEKHYPFIKVMSRIILQAWAAREALVKEPNEPEALPRIVSKLNCLMAQMTPVARDSNTEQSEGPAGMNNDDFFIPMLMDFVGDGPTDHFGGQGPMNSRFGAFPGMPGQAAMSFGGHQLGWTSTDWNAMYRHSY